MAIRSSGIPQAEHTIAEHTDTTATGAELDTLTDGSNADTEHAHAENPAAAPQAEKQIGLRIRRHCNRGVDGMNRRFRLAAVKDINAYADVGQRSANLIDQPRIDQRLVGDDKDSMGVQTLCDLAQLPDGTAAEQQLSGIVKRPGCSHGSVSLQDDCLSGISTHFLV